MSQIEPPEPKAQRLLAVLANEIKGGRIHEGEPDSFPSYSRVLELLGRPRPWAFAGSRLKNLGLADLNIWTMRHDELPKIAALIVNKSTHMPSEKFAESHDWHTDDPHFHSWWLEQANRAIRYDWTPHITLSYKVADQSASEHETTVREDEDEEGYGNVIVASPPPARIRTTGIKVGEVLQWLAAGESEKEILSHHPGLKGSDIRASLAFAAERELKSEMPSTSSFTERWTGKFNLPQPDPDDPRLTYLLERYERGSK